MSSEHQHDWQPAGRVEPHVTFIGREPVPVIYLRCECGWNGFRYRGRKVVFTWNPEDA
jgi:hypothetical protein